MRLLKKIEKLIKTPILQYIKYKKLKKYCQTIYTVEDIEKKKYKIKISK